jgi:hypothetical protein
MIPKIMDTSVRSITVDCCTGSLFGTASSSSNEKMEPVMKYSIDTIKREMIFME